MPEIRSDKIGLETGTYLLPCGCRIYVYFPGGTIHFDSGWVTTRCAELNQLWQKYWGHLSWGGGDPHSWDSLTAYIECLRHVGVWEGRIKTIEKMRSYHPNPADNHDYPKPEAEEQSALAAA